ncbi:hypothetical protein ZEAMMB73_Zm00001d002032 [Zea mays]|uniref:Non-specific serine/threonine protein kinase n=1 Tax=Zea mays TaxID=4577 RepID=A0A1D6DVV7_MAIZE|nr:hypothetical protein ZEAMMB73_Zm00001d002032 [Zea mays]
MEASYTQDSKLSGMELNGTLDYQLLSLQALKTMDLSNNHLHDSIPYQLPSNLTYLNLAKNNFSGNLPYSISNLVSLEYLNLSHNSLFQKIGEFSFRIVYCVRPTVYFRKLEASIHFQNFICKTINYQAHLMSLATLALRHCK